MTIKYGEAGREGGRKKEREREGERGDPTDTYTIGLDPFCQKIEEEIL